MNETNKLKIEKNFADISKFIDAKLTEAVLLTDTTNELSALIVATKKLFKLHIDVLNKLELETIVAKQKQLLKSMKI